MPDLNSLNDAQLFIEYRRVVDELQRRGLTRSGNNVVADYAEYIVVKGLKLKLAPPSTSGYDATDSAGKRYQIKGRRLASQNKSRQLGIIRDMELQKFDFLVGVLFDENYAVLKACQIPFSVVEEIARPNKHQNGHIVHLPESLWNTAGVQDITKEVQAAIEPPHEA